MVSEASAQIKRHPCDLCSSQSWAPLPLKDPKGVGICNVCGFCYVRDRRSADVIAADWSNVYGEGYDPDNWPAVRARLFYVAEWINTEYGLGEDKAVLDVGAGTGTFIKILNYDFHTVCTGLEPSAAAEKARCVRGSVEDDMHFETEPFDFVTINWTLENCHDPIKMLDYARRRLKPDGRVIVATGSRILVPYKKRLSSYLGNNSPDLHCFRWSEMTLKAAMMKAGLFPEKTNRYEECDWLVVSGTPQGDVRHSLKPPYDSPQEVIDYFRKWQEQWP